MDLLQEPVLDSRRVLFAPDHAKSYDTLLDYLVHCAAYDIAHEMAAAEGVEYSEFVISLETMKGKKGDLYDRALDRAYPIAHKLNGLTERVSHGIAYKLYRRKVHEKLGEENNFANYLLKKLDEIPDDESIGRNKTLEQTVFLLEVIEWYEKISKNHNLHHDIFSNELTYGKMVAAIPALREKYTPVKAAHILLEEKQKEIDERIKALRTARSDALFKSEDPTPYDTQITEARKEYDRVTEESEGPIERLDNAFLAYTQAAVDLAQSPVDRSLIASSLPKKAEEKLIEMGLEPAKVLSDTEERRTKPVAWTIHDDSDVIVTFKVKSRFFKVVQKLIEPMLDIRIGTIEDGEALLGTFKNPRKGKGA